MSKILQWEKAPYGKQAYFVDIAEFGRFHIYRKAPRSRTFIVKLNNEISPYSGTLEQCKNKVQSLVNDLININNNK